MTLELSQQQRQAVQDRTGEGRCEVIDPDTRCAYVLLAREQYERMHPLLESVREPTQRLAEVASGIPPRCPPIPADILAQPLPPSNPTEATRAVGVLLREMSGSGLGLTHGLIRECGRRGILDDAFYLGRIHPQGCSPWEPEDVEPLGCHHLEDDPPEP